MKYMNYTIIRGPFGVIHVVDSLDEIKSKESAASQFGTWVDLTSTEDEPISLRPGDIRFIYESTHASRLMWKDKVEFMDTHYQPQYPEADEPWKGPY